MFKKTKMIQRVFLLLLLTIVSYNSVAQDTEKFTVLFYNVENLFDTIDAPGIADEEFTPAGSKNWTAERYNKKIQDIGRVMNSLPEPGLPAIIGMAEIENKTVLNDLVHTPGLAAGHYRIVHEDSKDARGIDCALLYREDLFHYKDHEAITVTDPRDSTAIYREILHVWGTAPDGKMLHIFVNHWKSRNGGVQQTEYQRMISAVALRRQIDQLYSKESNPRVIVLGDFNDEPTNRSMTDVLHAANKRKNIALGDLYNLMYDMNNFSLDGSYNYRGTWQNYDQIVISYNLIDQHGQLSTAYDGGKVLAAEWMMGTYNGNKVPARVYGGNEYLGGVSDHLPVYVTFTW